MNIFPHSKQDWLRFVVFPFKAYVIIAPVLLLVSSELPRPRHSGATDAEVFLVLGLIPCSQILLLAALIFALLDRRVSRFLVWGLVWRRLFWWYYLCPLYLINP